MALRVRNNIAQMTPYTPGKPAEEVRRELGLDRVVKLASNENPLGPSPQAIAAVQDAANRMHLYPDAAAFDLRRTIADHFGADSGQILLGNGSDELIHLLGLLFLGSETDELIMAKPGFPRYDAAAELAPARIVGVPLTADFTHDLDAMADAVTANTRLIFVANPHNPTGTTVTAVAFTQFLDRIPESVPVVLDEAYHEFAVNAPDMPNGLDYVREGRNVVALRTFSKAYGLAGIRIGFGFAPAALVSDYHRAREPFNVNSLAQAAAIAALADTDHLERTVANNTAGLERLNGVFRRTGATPVASHANFAYANLGQDAAPISAALLQRGIIVRAGAHVGHPHCIRVSVGTPEELDAFEAAFLSVIGG